MNNRIFFLVFFTLTLSLTYANDMAQIELTEIQKAFKKAVGAENVKLVLFTTKQEDAGAYYAIKPNDDTATINGYVYAGKVDCCRAGGCSNLTSQSQYTSEYFEYIIVFDAQGKVSAVRVFNYQATYGQEVTAKSWLKQFIGFAGDKVLQPGKDIDAISGATISVYAITADIEYRTKEIKKNLKL